MHTLLDKLNEALPIATRLNREVGETLLNARQLDLDRLNLPPEGDRLNAPPPGDRLNPDPTLDELLHRSGI